MARRKNKSINKFLKMFKDTDYVIRTDKKVRQEYITLPSGQCMKKCNINENTIKRFPEIKHILTRITNEAKIKKLHR